LKDAKRIIKMSGVGIVGPEGKSNTKPIIKPAYIALNGTEEGQGDYEAFVFEAKDTGFNFCKTVKLPYDVVVKAILILAKRRGYLKRWRFNGDRSEEEYINAVKLYNKAMAQTRRRNVNNKSNK
jgi:hypothetical protein